MGVKEFEEIALFVVLSNYSDVLDATRTWDNAASKMEIFCLHLLNHWFKSRTVVVAHDEMLKKMKFSRAL